MPWLTSQGYHVRGPLPAGLLRSYSPPPPSEHRASESRGRAAGPERWEMQPTRAAAGPLSAPPGLNPFGGLAEATGEAAARVGRGNEL